MLSDNGTNFVAAERELRELVEALDQSKNLQKSLTTRQAKKYDISKQHSKQAIRQGKLRQITKCLRTRFL